TSRSEPRDPDRSLLPFEFGLVRRCKTQDVRLLPIREIPINSLRMNYFIWDITQPQRFDISLQIVQFSKWPESLLERRYVLCIIQRAIHNRQLNHGPYDLLFRVLKHRLLQELPMSLKVRFHIL